MNKLLIPLAVLTAFSAQAKVITPETLTRGAFTDTEDGALYPLAFDNRALRGYEIQLAVRGTSSNNVEVALGADRNASGRLELDEVGLTVGWDAGAWRIDSPSGATTYTPEGDPTNEVKRATFRFGAKDERFLDRTWTHAQVIVRGVDDPDEHVRVETQIAALKVIVR